MDKIDEKILKDYVEAEYKGVKYKFYSIPLADLVEFSELLTSNPTIILQDEKRLKSLIAKSLRKDEKDVRATIGFYVFALDNILEAVDFDFFLKHSKSLIKKLEKMREETNEETSPTSSVESQEPLGGQENTSSQNSP